MRFEFELEGYRVFPLLYVIEEAAKTARPGTKPWLESVLTQLKAQAPVIRRLSSAEVEAGAGFDENDERCEIYP